MVNAAVNTWSNLLTTFGVTNSIIRKFEAYAIEERTSIIWLILRHDSPLDGTIWWGFALDDVDERRSDLELEPEHLPQVEFIFDTHS